MKQYAGWSSGKLILSGEHSVVYGYPAIAIPISLGVHITLTEIEPTTTSIFPVLDERLTTAWKKIFPSTGIKLDMQSDVPLGAGLGSSAAISIASLRALAAYKNHLLSFSWLYEQGFVMEREFHGTPSGLDHAVCAAQQAMYFRREGPEMKPLSLPSYSIVIMHSAQPKQTSTMVEHVRSQWPQNKTILEKIGAITESIAHNPQMSVAELGAKLTENHHLLQDLGVSTPILDQLVNTALEAGALGAKLAGAGGGGIAFALTDNPTPIQSAIEKLGYECFCLHTPNTP